MSKGGVGKSMMSLNLAVAAADKGARVLLIDTDVQGSTATAFETRKNLAEVDNSAIPFKEVNFMHVTDSSVFNILTQAPAEYDQIFVDTQGADTAFIWKIANASDLVVVPVAAGMADVNAVAEVATKLMYYKDQGADFRSYSIRTNHRENTRLVATITANLAFFKDSLPMLNISMRNRAIYAEAFSYGAGVLEYAPKTEAAGEIRKLYKELYA